MTVRSNPVKLSTGEAITDEDGAPATLFFAGITPESQEVLGIPFITALAFTSDAGGNGTYGLRDGLDLTVTYSEDVTVSGGNNLTLELDLDGTPRTATYAEGAGTSRLVFRYIVSRGDADADGLLVPANAIGVGGTIQGTGTGTPAADRRHSVLAAQPAHKVNGGLPSVTAARNGVCGSRRRPGIGAVDRRNTDWAGGLPGILGHLGPYRRQP